MVSASTPPALWKLLSRIVALLTLVYGFWSASDRTIAALTPQITDYQYYFTAMPPNDDALLRWGRSRPGIERFEVQRLPNDPLGNLLIRVRSKQHITSSVNSIALRAPFESWGYRGGGCMVTDKSSLWPPKLVLGLNEAFMGLAGVLGLWWARRARETMLPLFAGRTKTVLATSLIGIVVSVLVQVIGRTALALLLRQPHWDPSSSPLLFVASIQESSDLLTTIVLGPIAEECFFRAFVFGSLAGSGYVKAGYLVSSLLFALSHAQAYNPWFLVLLFFDSFILVWSYRRSENLAAPVCIHVLGNGMAALGRALS